MSGLQVRRVNRLVRALKSGGVWYLLDRLWLFAAENSTQALIDLKSRSTATAVNSPTFTAGRGYAGNGSTAYINTGFNPTSGSPNYTQNSASYGCWIETADTTTSHRIMGNDSANYSELSVGSPNYAFSSNQGAPAGTTTPTSTTGLFGVSRPASNAVALYVNGVSVATASNASIAIPNNNFFLLAGNNAGAAFVPSSARLSMAFMGALNATQQANLYFAIRPYLTQQGVA